MTRGSACALAQLALPLVLLLLLAAAACSSAAPASQRIVFVDSDFALFTVDVDGSDVRPMVSPDAEQASPDTEQTPASERVYYFWPTTSPAGDVVAASRSPGTEEGSGSALVLFSAEGGGEQVVQTAVPGPLRGIASTAPHYAQWSSDGRYLTFLPPVEGARDMEMFVASESDFSRPLLLVNGAPIYHAWAPDGTAVLIHHQGRMLRYTPGGQRLEDLGEDSLLYRTPAVSPDGTRYASITYLPNDAAPMLVVSSVAGGEVQPLLEVDGPTDFLWSPSDELIAVATQSRNATFYHDVLELVDVETGERRVIMQREVVAFYWSPNGQRLAIVHGSSDLALQWSVVDVATEVVLTTAFYIPSPEYFTQLSFFDQYAYSHSPWSPDSSSLVFAGKVPATPDVVPEALNQVYVLDVDSGGEPVAIAEGALAFWVPPIEE